MRVLAVRQPFASLIAEGLKTIEIRSRHTRIREDIAIYASRTKPLKEEIGMFYDHVLFRGNGKYLPYGKIICVASLDNCIPVSSPHDFLQSQPEHRNPIQNYVPGRTFYWMLGNVHQVEPIDFKFSGSIVWSDVSGDLLISRRRSK